MEACKSAVSRSVAGPNKLLGRTPMPMRPRMQIWSALLTVHLAAGVWSWVGEWDRLGAIVAGSIYLPLWPLGELGVPVFRQNGWFFPPPTYLGWVIVVVFWLVAYWCIAGLLAHLSARRNRAA